MPALRRCCGVPAVLPRNTSLACCYLSAGHSEAVALPQQLENDRREWQGRAGTSPHLTSLHARRETATERTKGKGSQSLKASSPSCRVSLRQPREGKGQSRASRSQGMTGCDRAGQGSAGQVPSARGVVESCPPAVGLEVAWNEQIANSACERKGASASVSACESPRLFVFGQGCRKGPHSTG